jgi:hypothetical protein
VVNNWTPLLESRTTTDEQTLNFISNVEAISAKIHSGNKPRLHNNLDIALSTMKATLALLASHEHRKLPKTPQHTCEPYTSHGTNISTKRIIQQQKAFNYETATTHPCLSKGAKKETKRRPMPQTYTLRKEK